MLRGLAVVAALLAFAPVDAVAQSPSTSGLYVNNRYDHHADPYRDLERGIERAAAENKRVLIVVGGDWCVWCDILDRFLAQNAEVRTAFEESFVIVKVNWSRQNENLAFLSGFPESVGYPDFFIVGGDGVFLGRQRTDVLERGRDYDRDRMLAFARSWRVN